MRLLGFNFGKEVEKQLPQIPENYGGMEAITSSFKMSANLPVINTNTNTEFVFYGKDNKYPIQLIEAYNSSPIHQSIVNVKSKLSAGNGFTYNDSGLDSVKKSVLDKLVNFTDGTNNLEYILSKIAFDWQLGGAFCLEIVWSLDFTNIVKMKWVPFQKVRIGKEVNGEVEYYYISDDWYSGVRPKYVKLPKFDVDNKSDYNQILYVKNERPGVDYYGTPNYTSALNWILLDTQVGLFHKSNMENGFHPGVSITFMKKATPEEKEMYASAINKFYAGARNAGRALLFWVDGKDNAPEVKPIEVSNIDKQFTVISDQIINQILTAHSVTSPELFGVPVPGKLGTGDIEMQYKIFEKTVVGPDRKLIQSTINRLLIASGMNVDFTINEFNPLGETNINPEV